MKIFWSWQSDTPGKIGRHLIRDALKEAVVQLKESADEIEESVREELHVDHDIQDVPGSPDLAATILGKIDASKIVVADVTVVGEVVVPTPVEKKLINSNVAIELGYAFKSVGGSHVVLVFNEHFGSHEDLPFDLRHKGGAITFRLPPDAENKSIAEEKRKLKDRFVQALKPYLQDPAKTTPSPAEIPSTFNASAYFARSEVLARGGEPGLTQVTYSYDTELLGYIRLIPAKPLLEEIRLPVLRAAAQTVPLLTREQGLLSDINEHGAIGVRAGSFPNQGAARIEASTQLFENGEIWSIGASLIKTESPDYPRLPVPYMLSVVFEQLFYDTLDRLISFASRALSLSPPWGVELGISGSKGLNFLVPAFGAAFLRRGPILKNEIVTRATLKNAEDSEKLLLAFFSKVHDATGTARPDAFCGFPPDRPGSRI